jgi:hypothetical protein
LNDIFNYSRYPQTPAEILANGNNEGNLLTRTFWSLRPPSKREDLPYTELPPLPSYWSTDGMPYKNAQGQDMSADVLTCANVSPAAVIGYVSGWKGDPLNLDERRTIERLRAAGFTVVATSLERPHNDVGSMESNINRIGKFINDPQSPLYTRHPQHIPRFLITHSTAALVSEICLLEQSLAGKPSPKILHAYPTAGFFETSGASAVHDPRANKVYTGHALRHAYEYAGDPLADRLLYAWRGLGVRLRYKKGETSPVHAQILEIASYGLGHYSRLKNMEARGERNRVAVPRTFVISENDSFASPDMAKQIASMSPNAQIMNCKADHNPMMNVKALNVMIADMRTKSAGYKPQLEEEQAPSWLGEQQPV